jgi:hypothetical protein
VGVPLSKADQLMDCGADGPRADSAGSAKASQPAEGAAACS